MSFVAEVAAEDRQRQVERVRQAMAVDPGLLEFAELAREKLGATMCHLKTPQHEFTGKDWREVIAHRKREAKQAKVKLPSNNPWHVYRYASQQTESREAV